MKLVVENLDELQAFADTVAADLGKSKAKGAAVIALSGDLGAGKTAFTKALAKSLGVSTTINSPTFVIEKVYLLEHARFNKLIHIDAYRLDHPEELAKLGFAGLLEDPSNLVVVEWAERVQPLIPENAFKIVLNSAEDSDHRHITYHAAK